MLVKQAEVGKDIVDCLFVAPSCQLCEFPNVFVPSIFTPNPRIPSNSHVHGMHVHIHGPR